MLREELYVNDRLQDNRLIATHLFNKFSDLYFLSQGITFDRTLYEIYMNISTHSATIQMYGI